MISIIFSPHNRSFAFSASLLSGSFLTSMTSMTSMVHIIRSYIDGIHIVKFVCLYDYGYVRHNTTQLLPCSRQRIISDSGWRPVNYKERKNERIKQKTPSFHRGELKFLFFELHNMTSSLRRRFSFFVLSVLCPLFVCRLCSVFCHVYPSLYPVQSVFSFGGKPEGYIFVSLSFLWFLTTKSRRTVDSSTFFIYLNLFFASALFFYPFWG